MEIDYNKVVISNVRRLTPAQQQQQQEEEEEDCSEKSIDKKGVFTILKRALVNR